MPVCPVSGKRKNGEIPRFFAFDFYCLPQGHAQPQPPGTAAGGKKSSIGNSTASKTLHGSSQQQSPPASVHSLDGMQ